MTLSIIIVSYNVKYFLEQCLCSVKEAIQNIEAEVFVIDNCSPDDTIAYLQPQFQWVKFVQNQTNEGFAGANNKALQIAKGEYILFLNPDTILAEDTLEQCIFFYKNKPNAGAVGVRMIDGKGNFLPESKRSFPSPAVSFYKLSGLSSLFPKHKQFGKYALNFLPEKEVHEVDVIAGAFMMIPKQILDATGSFDEQFFMYAEDIDLSYRIQQKGYKNYYLGSVTIVHFKGESTKKGSFQYVKVFYNAMNLFVKKWYRSSGAWLLRQSLQAGIYVRGFVSYLGLSLLKKNKTKPQLFDEIVCIGNTNRTSVAEDILHNHYQNNRIKKESDSKEDVASFNNKMIVFCIGDLSYQKSIALLQQTKAASYKWFGKNSHSIVGSDNKNKSGDVIVIDEK
ncbi:MAG: glycosyltransferase family 2 protein [Bacteroidota bacterium]|nr:glycosyltransferase family 2 protein [Bacteroidota bacterium]